MVCRYVLLCHVPCFSFFRDNSRIRFNHPRYIIHFGTTVATMYLDCHIGLALRSRHDFRQQEHMADGSNSKRRKIASMSKSVQCTFHTVAKAIPNRHTKDEEQKSIVETVK